MVFRLKYRFTREKRTVGSNIHVREDSSYTTVGAARVRLIPRPHHTDLKKKRGYFGGARVRPQETHSWQQHAYQRKQVVHGVGAARARPTPKPHHTDVKMERGCFGGARVRPQERKVGSSMHVNEEISYTQWVQPKCAQHTDPTACANTFVLAGRVSTREAHGWQQHARQRG